VLLPLLLPPPPACPGLRWSQLYSYCRYQPDPSLQSSFDPREEFRSYECIYPLWQVSKRGERGVGFRCRVYDGFEGECVAMKW
jgi:hypothetical protein